MLRLAPHVRPRLAGLVLATLAVVVAPAAAGAGGGPSQRAQELRAREAAIASKSRAAVLSLYALDSQLVRARARLSTISSQAASVRRQRADVAARLRLARRDAAVAQRRLGERLRALYEQGEIDPLAIVLGARSLGEAMTGLDNLGQMVQGERQVLAEVQHARAKLVALKVRLGERQRRLERLAAAAAASERQLASARDSRSAYVSQLASQRRLAQARISQLEAQARAAVAKSKTLSAPPRRRRSTCRSRRAPRPPPDTTAADAGAAPQPGQRAITVVATGYSLPGHTATGLPVGWGVVAVDPSVIPLGTRLTVPGYGEAVAADVGSAIRGAMIDLWFPTVDQARQWGRRSVTVTLHQ